MSTLHERMVECFEEPHLFSTHYAANLLREAAEALRNAEDDTQQAIDNGSEAVAEWQKAHEESQAELSRMRTALEEIRAMRGRRLDAHERTWFTSAAMLAYEGASGAAFNQCAAIAERALTAGSGGNE